jgi:hypothetical protein
MKPPAQPAAQPPTSPDAHRVNKTTEIAADFEGTWSALIDVFSDRDWTIDNMDKASGLITTDWMTMSSRDADVFADCGTNTNTARSRTMVRFNVRVKPHGEATSVTVNTSFRMLGGIVSPIDCTSRGGMERWVHRELSGRTGRAPNAPAPDAGVVDAR